MWTAILVVIGFLCFAVVMYGLLNIFAGGMSDAITAGHDAEDSGAQMVLVGGLGLLILIGIGLWRWLA